MSRIAWSTAPSLQRRISVPPPPSTDDPAVQDWMQQVSQALAQLSEPDAELQSFLDDVLSTIKELDRDGINALSSISDTAGGAYTAAEQTMLANLKTAVNGLLTNL